MSGISFEPGNARAADIVDGMTAHFVGRFGEVSGPLIQSAVKDGLSAGHGVRKVAVGIRNVVGSSDRQKRSVERYRARLTQDPARALRHPLRDRRADRALIKAVDGKPLPADRVDRLCAEMDARMTAVRSEAIAIEFSFIAMSQANYFGTIASAEAVGIPAANVYKRWMGTKDGRNTWVDRELDELEIPILQPFVLSNGIRLRFPFDPMAPRSTRLRCRGVLSFRFDLDQDGG